MVNNLLTLKVVVVLKPDGIFLEEGMKMATFYINFGDARAYKGCGHDDVNMWVHNVALTNTINI